MRGEGTAVTEIAYDEIVCELRALLAEPPKLGKGALPHVMGAMLQQPDFCRQLLEVIEAARRRGVSLSEFIMAYVDAEHELRPIARARARGA
jgi:hypothetical protein